MNYEDYLKCLEKDQVESFTPLMIACIKNDIKAVKEELGKNPECIDYVDNCNSTAIMYAAQLGFAEIVKYLINYNANLFIKNSINFTILDYCIDIHWKRNLNLYPLAEIVIDKMTSIKMDEHSSKLRIAIFNNLLTKMANERIYSNCYEKIPELIIDKIINMDGCIDLKDYEESLLEAVYLDNRKKVSEILSLRKDLKFTEEMINKGLLISLALKNIHMTIELLKYHSGKNLKE